MNKQKRFLLSLILFITLIGTGIAQQVGSNSPYGRYGYGLLSSPTVGSTESMGGISYGIRRGRSINPGNPASYSKADSLNFTIEMGVSGQYSRLSDGLNNQSFRNGNFDYLAFQFLALKNLGVSVGVLPFSKVGYEFGRNIISEEIQYREDFNGSGGLSQIYGGVAYSPLKHLSVGANVSYLFGSITHSRNIPIIGVGDEATKPFANNSFSIRNMMLDFGAQLTYPINAIESVTLGAVYTPKIKTKSNIYHLEKSYSETLEEVLKEETYKDEAFDIPDKFGVGLSYKTTNLLVGIDGSLQRWSGSNYPQYLDSLATDTRFNDKYSVNAGIEYVVDPVHRNFFKRVRLRGGLSYSNSYINTNVYDPKDSDGISLGAYGYKEYGVNVGFGLPFRDALSGRTSMINLGFGYSLMKPNHKYMIKEQMFKVSINININEYWFFKRQFD